jgi:hypothetical protein
MTYTQEQFDSLLGAYGELLRQNEALRAKLVFADCLDRMSCELHPLVGWLARDSVICPTCVAAAEAHRVALEEAAKALQVRANAIDAVATEMMRRADYAGAKLERYALGEMNDAVNRIRALAAKDGEP